MEKKIMVGTITEVMAAGLYKVQFEDGKERLCFLAGKMKMNHVRVLVGDSVMAEIDPYGGKATNRIVRRLP